MKDPKEQRMKIRDLLHTMSAKINSVPHIIDRDTNLGMVMAMLSNSESHLDQLLEELKNKKDENIEQKHAA